MVSNKAPKYGLKSSVKSLIIIGASFHHCTVDHLVFSKRIVVAMPFLLTVTQQALQRPKSS